MVDDLPTTFANSGNDTSRLDFGVAVQLKKSRDLTDAEKYDFLKQSFCSYLKLPFSS